jgi:hypothetical protein
MKLERSIRIPTDRFSSLVLLLLAILYSVAGRRLPIWAQGGLPGPALTPRILALALALLAAIIWFQAKPVPNTHEGKTSWGKSVVILFSLFLYYLALPLLGYTLCNFGLMLVLRRTFEPGSWAWDISGSAMIAAAAYLVFVRMFGLSFTEFFLWE